MTDEMRAAESLVRALAPSGHEVPIPEPLALDESRWLIIAVEKGLLEFTRCTDACAPSRRAHTAACDHFETGSDDPHHLFAHIGRAASHCTANTSRRLRPTPEPYSTSGTSPPEACCWSTIYPSSAGEPVHRRQCPPYIPHKSRYGFRDTEFHDTGFRRVPRPDSSVQLQIVATGDRQATRRIATALDAVRQPRSDSDQRLPARSRAAAMVKPRFLWLVGPNTVEPAGHVFRVARRGDSATFARCAAVPAPV